MKVYILILVMSFGFSAQALQKPACELAREYSKLLRLAKPKKDMRMQMRAFRKKACSDAYSEGETIKYDNGQVATNWAGQEGATWFYPNGQKVTDWAGQKDATWYYPNGAKVTDWAYQVGATWYYPNGQKVTDWAYQVGATWYYSNGEKVTDWAGQKDATYYHRDGTVADNWGPEFTLENGQLDINPFLRFVLSYQFDD